MKKRADGRYLKQVFIGYGSDGKPKYKNVYGYSQAEVNNRAELLKAEINKGIAVIDDIILSDWADRWFMLYKSNSAINTQKMYENLLETHIKPTVGKLKLKKIKPHHLQEVVNNLLADGKYTTAKQFKMTMKQILKSAIDNNYVYKNVAEGIKLPKKERTQKRSLTDIEKKYIKNAKFTPKQRAFISIIQYLGLRRGEALALNLSDFDIENKTVDINKTIIYKENDAMIKQTPKTDAGTRTLPMPDTLLNVIEPYLSELAPGELLFTMNNGQPMSRSSFVKFWNGIIKELKLVLSKDEELNKDITPHIFRHSYATSLYYAGVDIKTAQYLLGHSSIQMTLNVYTHLEQLENSNISDKLNSYFK